MSDDSEKILRSMRTMAWERAKGELRSMLETFWSAYESGTGKPANAGYDSLNAVIKKFISEVEDNGLQE